MKLKHANVPGLYVITYELRGDEAEKGKIEQGSVHIKAGSPNEALGKLISLSEQYNYIGKAIAIRQETAYE